MFLLVALSGCAEEANGQNDWTDESDSVDLQVTSDALVTSSMTYMANDQFFVELPSCNTEKRILIKEPDAAGSYPLFIYTTGTTEPYNSASAVAIITEAARQGFLAASVEYQSGSLPQTCGENGWYKARCAYSTAHNAQSAIAKLCAHPKAGSCSKGIVTAGISQGGSMAAHGRNFDVRVRGTWAMGFEDRHWTGAVQPCLDYGTGPLGTSSVRLLANNRLRIIRGRTESYNVAALNNTTGSSCTAGPCLRANGSGWYITTDSEVNFAVNPNGHCYLQNNPMSWGQKVDCGNSHVVDPVFARIPPATTYASGMYQNIAWLKNTILPLGNQP